MKKYVSKKIISLMLSTTMLASNVMITRAEDPKDTGAHNDVETNNDTDNTNVNTVQSLLPIIRSAANIYQSSETSVLGVVNTATTILNNWSSISCNTKRILRGPMMFGKRFAFKKFGGFKDREEALKALDKEFRKIKGQTEVKEQIKTRISSLFARLDPDCPSEVKGNVLYLAGPSGVGKSYIARLISEAILKHPESDLYRVDPARIQGSRYGDSLLTCFYRNKSGDTDQSMVNVDDSTLPLFLMEHPQGIVWLDEYDKYCQTTDFDEKIRQIVDEGKLVINSTSIDCSKILFIITSNEVIQALNNRFKPIEKEKLTLNNEDTEMTSGNNMKVKPTRFKNMIDDNTDGSTYVNHDRSFLNRLMPIMFKSLGDKNFEAIAQSFLKTKLDYFKNACGMKIEIGSNVVPNMVKYAKFSNKQARGISFDLDTLLIGEMVKYAYNEDLNTTTFELSYDFDKEYGKKESNYLGEFKLKEKVNETVKSTIDQISYSESFEKSLNALLEKLNQTYKMKITLDNDFQSSLNEYKTRNKVESELFEKLKGYLSGHLDAQENFEGKEFVLDYKFNDTEEDDFSEEMVETSYGEFCLRENNENSNHRTCKTLMILGLGALGAVGVAKLVRSSK